MLREHCASVGRPYEAIEKTTLDSFALTRDGRDGSMTPSAVLDTFAQLAEMGVDQAIFSLRNVSDPAAFELLATEVVPQAEKIHVAGR